MNTRRQQDGQTSVEWLGVCVIAGVLVLVLVQSASRPAARIVCELGVQIENVTGGDGGSCGDEGSQSTARRPGAQGGAGGDANARRAASQRRAVSARRLASQRRAARSRGAGGGVGAKTSASSASKGSKQAARLRRRIAIAYRYFRKKGLSRAQAAGLVGNLQQESGGQLNPAQKQFGGGPGRGIGQWTYGDVRWKALLKFAHSRGHSWKHYETQVQFVWHELRTTESAALRALRGARSVAAATREVMNKYERPDPNQNHYEDRLRHAQAIYDRFG